MQNFFSVTVVCKHFASDQGYLNYRWDLIRYAKGWSLTLREERRLRVFENRVLRRVFGPKRDEVTGE
jgi:hypothetical protein